MTQLDFGQEGSSVSERRSGRKPPTKAEYLFPAYDFGLALDIAARVERDGGGMLTEETLAIALGLSAKSSGFRLKALTARQFGLLEKRGATIVTTPLAKAILKPTSEDERVDRLKDAILRIPLFAAVAARFRGVPLPQGPAFRNILEREFKVEAGRVQAAEHVLMESARKAGLLYSSGGNTYLRTDGLRPTPAQIIEPPSVEPQVIDLAGSAPTTRWVPGDRRGIWEVTEDDLIAVDEGDFSEVWEALGKLVRARRKRMQKAGGQEENPDRSDV